MTNINKKTQSNLDTSLFNLVLDKRSKSSLQAQLANALRALLIGGQDYSGARLPPSRKLAEELSVSRTTVTSAYDQLLSEGYIFAQVGGGTFVAAHMPHLNAPIVRVEPHQSPPQALLPFHPGVPDQTLFPHRIWARHLERAWRQPEAALLARADPFGWYPLRTAIADHLSIWRGLECRAEQIIITSGAWEAFEIIFRGLLDPGQTTAIEDPGWPLLRDVLRATGTTARPVRIDNQGLDATKIAAGTSTAIVTPSRHYPTGTAMPLARRTALLDWARRTGSLVIEDDYDSEFRYQGHPLPSLSGLDQLNQSIYLGSFSKLLSPAMRIGYMVLPETRVDPAKAYLARAGARASLVPQPALATFMNSGEFAIHLRRMRRTYVKRQNHLVAALSGLKDLLDVAPDPSGMHICAALSPKLRQITTDQDIARRGQNSGLYLRALSSSAVLPDPPQGIILGYAAFDEDTLSNAAAALVSVFADFRRF